MLDRKTIEEIKRILFRHLDPQKHQAFIFGSRAMGSGKKFSDIDIGIISPEKIGAELLGNIREESENSNLPYNIDIVDFNTVSERFRNFALKKIIKLN